MSSSFAQRQDWTFEYTASKLAEGAKAKEEFHQKRMEWWEGKKKEVMDKIKETGISVHDSVASIVSNYKSAGCGPEITIDNTMQRDLSECHSKMQEHHNLIKSYNGWRQVLEANPEARLKLTHDDWLFFFGK
jgi:hypothetical protein